MKILKWLAIVAMLSVLLLSVFISSVAAKFFQAKKNVANISVRPVKHKVKVTRWRKGKSDLLDYVISQAESAGVIVETATLNKINHDSMEVSFVLQGGFDEMINFIRLAVKNNIFLQVRSVDVITHSVHDEIRLTLDILNAQKIQPHETVHLPEAFHVFSENHFVNLLGGANDDLSHAQVEVIKYIGYFKAGNKKSGLILLSNGATHFVALGDTIGGAKVMRLDDSSVLLKTRDKVATLPLK